ncbi:hypothetical protein [Paracoccus fistulariae]|uniref:TNase-like domain-containing protein n=1 Tax=Paracoccus fistulariae TaxID=658446 RepID=A0ABY7SJN5_9RHOB|nr:hypothetical protein [Paracoccus fistulariae]MDB6181975.1 hypothetical protein [Paracoccus fistulariae]WCR06788.1 hypothetical protein JHX87_15115 [Paracoccus fistulariae]
MEKKEDLIVVEYKIRTYETLPSDKQDRKSKYAIFVDGQLIGLVNSPAYDGARLLVKMGYNPDRLMTTRAMDSQHYSWRPEPIRKFAKLRSVETDTRSIRSRSFREWARVGIEMPSNGFYDYTYLKDKKGKKTTDPGKATHD